MNQRRNLAVTLISVKVMREKGGRCIPMRHTHVETLNVGDDVSFLFRLYRGRWKAESFMKVHRVPRQLRICRGVTGEEGTGKKENDGAERKREGSARWSVLPSVTSK